MEPTETPGRWRRNAVAVFVTVHIACVVVYALPRPPVVDEAILNHPEVAAEVRGGPLGEVQARRMLALARRYVAVTEPVRSAAARYLRPIGSTQSWHMFGGTPPRFPLVFAVEVRSRGETGFVRFQDLSWGTADSAAMNFRHRKLHEILAAWAPPPDWDDYARYWARRWDEQHPDRPAAAVRLSVTRLTTPDPVRVRAGDADRHPEVGLQAHVWEVR